jgi:hypothetical protein
MRKFVKIGKVTVVYRPRVSPNKSQIAEQKNMTTSDWLDFSFLAFWLHNRKHRASVLK